MRVLEALIKVLVPPNPCETDEMIRKTEMPGPAESRLLSDRRMEPSFGRAIGVLLLLLVDRFRNNKATGLAQTFRSAVPYEARKHRRPKGLRQPDCIGSTCNVDSESIYQRAGANRLPSALALGRIRVRCQLL